MHVHALVRGVQFNPAPDALHILGCCPAKLNHAPLPLPIAPLRSPAGSPMGPAA
jgi:hypothetical protein